MPSSSPQRLLAAAGAAALVALLLLGSGAEAFLFSRCRLPARPALATKAAAAVGGASKPAVGLIGCVGMYVRRRGICTAHTNPDGLRPGRVCGRMDPTVPSGDVT